MSRGELSSLDCHFHFSIRYGASIHHELVIRNFHVDFYEVCESSIIFYLIGVMTLSTDLSQSK